MPQVGTSQVVRFATFEVDLQAQELRKGGLRLKLTGQPFQVLAVLLERPGIVVTREELQKRLWPDTFVDVDHNLNTAINKIREALGDSAENPRFVETLPRRGYRFIAPIETPHFIEPSNVTQGAPGKSVRQSLVARLVFLFGVIVVSAAAGFLAYKWTNNSPRGVQRSLTRLTFDDGLQIGATWSPDGRFLAYSSDRGGKFDIWVQQLNGGDPVRVTAGPGDKWQPEWSPDGKYIAYRSEANEGGIFVVPALGGAGFERKISLFGYYPHWSPDSSQLLFQTARFGLASSLYVVRLDGTPPREVMADLTSRNWLVSAAWHPDGKRISAWGWTPVPSPLPRFWTGPVDGGKVIQTQISPELSKIAGLASGRGISAWGDSDFKFAWAASGNAIYFERTFHGARNIWCMSVNPSTLEATGLERLTTGAGLDSELALSPDGSRLAFTTTSQRVQAWLFRFDANLGKIAGNGRAVTSAGMEAWNSIMSRDGQHLVSGVNRDGKWELWEKSLPEGPENPVFADDSYVRDEARWSPDGAHFAYVRYSNITKDWQVVTCSRTDHVEEPIRAPTQVPEFIPEFVFDWCPDGACVLTSRLNESDHFDAWTVPVGKGIAEGGPRKIIAAQPNYDLFQENFSPDGRWIVFEGVVGIESSVYVVPASGAGPWIRVTDGKHWADKPRWSPDGRTIYYISEEKGYFNVRGRRFNPEHRSAQGEDFAVTSFDSPKMMIGQNIPNVGLSVKEDRLVLTVAQVAGSIWVLDNVELPRGQAASDYN
jgi:Tol biopolymer transport system component/DNA-binding winged helix-turn-helix (wHTH) protein